MDEYYRVVRLLPEWLGTPLQKLPPATAQRVQEVRLRVGMPVCFTVQGRQLPAGEVLPEQSLPAVDAPAMEDIFYTLCGGCVHSFEDELSGGFITLPGGHRTGVGGVYLRGPDGRPVLQQVRSLNIRIARFLQCSLPAALIQLLSTHFTGLLVLGEPNSGKTTVLRSMLPLFAAQGRAVAVIDSRSELVPQSPDTLDAKASLCCDCIAGLDKATGAQMALRTLGPQVLLLDELGTLEEVCALEQAFLGGVDVVASLHASSWEEAARRPQVQHLRAAGMLRYTCLLAGRTAPGQVKAVSGCC